MGEERTVSYLRFGSSGLTPLPKELKEVLVVWTK
jgi:hypothetical protein